MRACLPFVAVVVMVVSLAAGPLWRAASRPVGEGLRYHGAALHLVGFWAALRGGGGVIATARALWLPLGVAGFASLALLVLAGRRREMGALGALGGVAGGIAAALLASDGKPGPLLVAAAGLVELAVAAVARAGAFA